MSLFSLDNVYQNENRLIKVSAIFNPLSRMIFTNMYEGLQSQTHLKGLVMAPCKLPCAVFIDQKIAR